MKEPTKVSTPLSDTEDLRVKLLDLWGKFERGSLDVREARIHIGFARATLDSLKVEIAEAHLGPTTELKPVSFQREALPETKVISAVKEKANG